MGLHPRPGNQARHRAPRERAAGARDVYAVRNRAGVRPHDRRMAKRQGSPLDPRPPVWEGHGSRDALQRRLRRLRHRSAQQGPLQPRASSPGSPPSTRPGTTPAHQRRNHRQRRAGEPGSRSPARATRPARAPARALRPRRPHQAPLHHAPPSHRGRAPAPRPTDKPRPRPRNRAPRRLPGILGRRERPSRATQAHHQPLRPHLARQRHHHRRQTPLRLHRLLHSPRRQPTPAPKQRGRTRGVKSGSDGTRTRDLCRDRAAL